jgi:hypothetical protein
LFNFWFALVFGLLVTIFGLLRLSVWWGARNQSRKSRSPSPSF